MDGCLLKCASLSSTCSSLSLFLNLDLEPPPRLPNNQTGRRAREEAGLHLPERAHHRLQRPGFRCGGRKWDLPYLCQRQEEGGRASGGDGKRGEGAEGEGGDGGERFFFFVLSSFAKEHEREGNGREGTGGRESEKRERENEQETDHHRDLAATFPFPSPVSLFFRRKQNPIQDRLSTLQRAEEEKTAKKRAKRQQRKVRPVFLVRVIKNTRVVLKVKFFLLRV